MAGPSLVTSLSQAFVAFTIEADNEFESRMPHRTAADRGNPAKTGPWLTSLTFWSNYLRHIPDEGCTARQLASIAGDDASAIASRLHELHRWGYVRVGSAPADQGERLITLTTAGRRARDTWAPIEALTEERWSARFGAHIVDALRAGLDALPTHPGLPLGFPILSWGRARGLGGAVVSDSPSPLGLSTLLARAVLSMSIDFDAQSPLSLATTLDLTRLLDQPAPIRDLPLRAGVSKEAIAIAVGRLTRGGLATVSDASKRVTLTPAGKRAAIASDAQRVELDERWNTATDLGEVLASIVTPRLAEGLEPHPDGWRNRSPYLAQTRATLADPIAALPHFPMVSHRGGYPDGS